MIWPFVVFSLPRSRSTWLSSYLSYGGLCVGHDLVLRADSCQQFFDHLWPLAGTCETGAMDGHALMRKAMPGAKFVVIHRSISEVAASLAKFRITDPNLERRSQVLDKIDGLHIAYDDLCDVRTCVTLWEYVYPGIPFDFAWWRHMDAQNVQVDVAAEVALQIARQQQIAALRREVAICPDITRIGWEPFDSFWADPDRDELCMAHYQEANGVTRYEPDIELLKRLEAGGAFRMLTARVNGKLVGYLMLSFTVDAECLGKRIADQGAWYVDQQAPSELAVRMLKWAIAELRNAGIDTLHLHHPLQGRGARLASLFRRLGARPNQHRYTLAL